MNVYDFDKTIYNGDSSIDFYFFCLKKDIFLVRYTYKMFIGTILYCFDKIDKTHWKEYFFSFLNGIKDIDSMIDGFWKKNIYKIKSWYMEIKREDDVIISASPKFIIEKACKSLGINNYIASEVDEKNGKFEGTNCYGKEKVIRFQKRFDNEIIEAFYSDSLSDHFMAEIAKNSYIVKGDSIYEWGEYRLPLINKLIDKLFSREFLLFILVGCVNALNGIVFSYVYSLLVNNVNISFVMGYVTSLTISYLLNSRITFKEKISLNKYFKFAVSYIPNFLIQNFMVFIFYNHLNWNRLVVYSMAAVLGVPITFLFTKMFHFGK